MAGMLNHRVAPSDPLDEIRRKPLTIRSLEPKRGIGEVTARVRGEFIEMRGFSPTIEQAARLFDLSREDCDSILGTLVQQGFLHRTSDGRYRLFPRR